MHTCASSCVWHVYTCRPSSSGSTPRCSARPPSPPTGGTFCSRACPRCSRSPSCLQLWLGSVRAAPRRVARHALRGTFLRRGRDRDAVAGQRDMRGGGAIAAEPGDDQLALLVANKDTVAVGDQKRVPPTALAGRLIGFPQRLSGLGVDRMHPLIIVGANLLLEGCAVFGPLGHAGGRAVGHLTPPFKRCHHNSRRPPLTGGSDISQVSTASSLSNMSA